MAMLHPKTLLVDELDSNTVVVTCLYPISERTCIKCGLNESPSDPSNVGKIVGIG